MQKQFYSIPSVDVTYMFECITNDESIYWATASGNAEDAKEPHSHLSHLLSTQPSSSQPAAAAPCKQQSTINSSIQHHATTAAIHHVIKHQRFKTKALWYPLEPQNVSSAPPPEP